MSSTSAPGPLPRDAGRQTQFRQNPARRLRPTRLALAVVGSTVAAAATAAGLMAAWPAPAAVMTTPPVSFPVTAARSSQPPGPAVAAAQPAGSLLAAKAADVISMAAGRRLEYSASDAARGSSGRSSAASSDPAGPADAVAVVASGTPQQIAMSMLGSFGWSADQFGCLDSLWNEESGWNPSASNPGTGAYGIPQALPGSKMASAGPDWASDPAIQIRWGLGYIQSIYRSPCAAWGHEQADGWY